MLQLLAHVCCDLDASAGVRIVQALDKVQETAFAWPDAVGVGENMQRLPCLKCSGMLSNR